MVHDESWYVCREVKHGRDKDLYILVHDKYPYVRAAVAEYGRYKDLDILVNDQSTYVR